jgi:hypothetical protein
MISMEGKRKNGTKSFEELARECEVDTEIRDLAEQHDHYLYGTPKREIPPHEIDEIVIAQSDVDDHWEDPIVVKRAKLQPELDLEQLT